MFDDRFGLRDARPVALRPLPRFPGDALDPARSGGDLCLQVCAAGGELAVTALERLTERDPRRQFVPVQRRLAERDALARFTRDTGSAVFAIPPGARPGGFLGEALVA